MGFRGDMHITRVICISPRKRMGERAALEPCSSVRRLAMVATTDSTHCTPEQLESWRKPTLPSTDLCCPVTSHTAYLERWRVYKQPMNASVSGERASALGRPCVTCRTAQVSGRQGWLSPACQLFWGTNRLTHGLLQRYQIFPQPFSIPPSGSALGQYCKQLRIYPVSLQSPWVNPYIVAENLTSSVK